MKEDLRRKARAKGSEQEKGLKKELKRIQGQINSQWKEGKVKHKAKVDHLKRKIGTKQQKCNARTDWITKMASGTEGKIPLPPIPKYGGVTTDEDEDAALRLPPNMPTLPKLTNENFEYEDQLSKTKLRYSRRTTGSLKEQEEEARVELDPV